MRRKRRKPTAGSRKEAQLKERAAQKAIMRANRLNEERYDALVVKYSHAGLWEAFSAGVAELGPRFEAQADERPNIVWHLLGWLYLKVRRTRTRLERTIREAETERS